MVAPADDGLRVDDGLRQTVTAYVRGEATIFALHDWLARHVQALADSPDAAARALDGLAWLLISEWSIGDRDEADVRRELADALTHAQSLSEGA